MIDFIWRFSFSTQITSKKWKTNESTNSNTQRFTWAINKCFSFDLYFLHSAFDTAQLLLPLTFAAGVEFMAACVHWFRKKQSMKSGLWHLALWVIAYWMHFRAKTYVHDRFPTSKRAPSTLFTFFALHCNFIINGHENKLVIYCKTN